MNAALVLEGSLSVCNTAEVGVIISQSRSMLTFSLDSIVLDYLLEIQTHGSTAAALERWCRGPKCVNASIPYS